MEDLRKEFLNTLAEQIDERAKAASDYALNNEDYAEPLFYEDWDVTTAHLDAEALELIAEAKKQWGKKWQVEIKTHCNLDRCGIYIQNDEISSLPIGELEEQLDGEIADELAKLTAEEREYVRRQVSECYLPDRGDCIYIDHNYDRWVLILDVERLQAALETANA